MLKTENSYTKILNPNEVTKICKYYSEKKSIDLQCINYTGERFSFITRFDDQRIHDCIETLNNNESKGFVLMADQFHAIPLMISRENDKVFLIIFDSTSGPRIKGYYALANKFPSCHFLINHGTRQEDSFSCMTDAVLVLKKSLRYEKLGTKLLDNVLDKDERYKSTSPVNSSSSLSSESISSCQRPCLPSLELKNHNFGVFYLPIEFLKTSQRESFISRSLDYYNGSTATINGTSYMVNKQEKWKRIGLLSFNC